jgi:hypothetical protein
MFERAQRTPEGAVRFFYFASNQIVKDLRRQTSDPMKENQIATGLERRNGHGKTTSINFWGI